MARLRRGLAAFRDLNSPVLLLAPVAILLTPTAASAELSVKVEGGSSVDVAITGTTVGHNVSYGITKISGNDRVTIDPHGAAWTSPAALPSVCTGTSGQPIVCDASPGEITVNLLAGDNILSIQSSTPLGYTPSVRLGDGDDHVTIANMGGAEVRIGAGDDTVQMTGPSGQGRDFVLAGDGKKHIALSDGEFDLVSFFGRTTAVTANLTGGTLSDGGTISGVEELGGTRYSDTLIGDGKANALNGGPGHDVVSGLGGNDELYLLEESQEVTDPWPAVATTSAESDSVDCADGYDSVTGDRLDLGTTDADCEKRMPVLDGFVTVNRATAAPGDVVTATPPAVLNPDSTTATTQWFRVTPGVEFPELLTDNLSYTVQTEDQYLIARTSLPLAMPQYRATVVSVKPASNQNPAQGGGGGGGGVDPAPQQPGGNPGAGTTPVVTQTTPAAGKPPTTSTTKPKPLTTKQKLAKALKQCKKKKSRKLRAACAKKARARYSTRKPKR